MPKKLKQWRIPYSNEEVFPSEPPQKEKKKKPGKIKVVSLKHPLKILIVCCARWTGDVVPELIDAVNQMSKYTRANVPERQPKDFIDFFILTEDLLRPDGKKRWGNQARRLNMNKIREHAYKNYDYIFKIDADIVPPRYALNRMIETSIKYNAPIVTSLTPERPSKCGNDNVNQVRNWNGNKNAKQLIEKGEPFICTGNAGEGFMVMTREALQKLRWPSYKHSGDFAFWREVRHQGIKYMCDPWVMSAHKERKGMFKGQLIRGIDWVIKRWKHKATRQDPWYKGFPYNWWRGMSMEKFFEELPAHLKSGEEPRWFNYYT